MQPTMFIILSALATIAGAWRIGGNGDINGFSWPKDSKDISSIRTRENVSFWAAHFEHFSKGIGDQFTNMKKLKFSFGSVQQIYINPKIEELYMFKTKTQKLEIDPDQEYAIISLWVGDCNLKSIPSNINHLRRLQKLDFWGNQIEHVKMSDFNGLNNLEELGLNSNGMKTLSSETTINLPMLRELKIYNNNLREINICSWEMPNLEEFDLDRNELKFIINLVDQFPKMKKIYIMENPLVCSWKDDLVRSAEIKNISLLERWYWKPTCNATDTSHAPSECPMVHSLSKQQSNILERQRSFEQSMRDSMKTIGSLEQLVKKSNDEIKSLKQNEASLTFQLQQMRIKSNDENQSLKQTVATLTDQFQKMAKKSNDELESLKQKDATLTDQLQQMAKKSNEEIQSLKQTEATLSNRLQQIAKKSSDENQSLTDQLQKMAKKSNDEIKSLKQKEATLTNQLQQMAKNSNDEIKSLKQTEATLTDQLQQLAKKSSGEIESLTDQLTKQRYLIDDLTEGFYRYVLEKEGGEK